MQKTSLLPALETRETREVLLARWGSDPEFAGAALGAAPRGAEPVSLELGTTDFALSVDVIDTRLASALCLASVGTESIAASVTGDEGRATALTNERAFLSHEVLIALAHFRHLALALLRGPPSGMRCNRGIRTARMAFLMLRDVLSSILEFEVGDAVVLSIPVLVMNVIALRNWAVMVFPNCPMKELARRAPVLSEASESLTVEVFFVHVVPVLCGTAL